MAKAWRTMTLLGQSHPVVAVDGFSGPFDLLLRLIERKELDVLVISLAQVTEQYLELLSEAKLRDPEHLSAFLVVAAKLLLIKSTLLLPVRARPTAAPDGAVDPTDLTERLRQYQQYRLVADWLGERNDAGLRAYPRSTAGYRPDRRRLVVRLSPTLLADAYRLVLARPGPGADAALPRDPRVTLAEALAAVQAALDQCATVPLDLVVGSEPSRQRFVAMFLAVLELVRLGRATAMQNHLFGEITLARAPPETSGDAAAPSWA
ncbi:MAG TPA: ScpA family protein [Chloroflexota bacterium]|nr:ScpA family protein [Chloroflexota bacterium]